MKEATTIGLDLAKNVFQVHGVDASDEPMIRRQLRRRQVIPFFRKLPPCLVGMEACATSHYWARELQALGHETRIMPANYVKPYVKRNKNDAADAEAICEAVTRPTMRFVAMKSAEQQSLMMLHRTRALLVRQHTMQVNAIRAHLAEFGVVAPVGRRGMAALLAIISDPEDERLPVLARTCLESLVVALMTVEQEVASNERRIHVWHRSSETSRNLETIPGIGPIIATALVTSVSDPSIFKSGRELAAWIGLVPKQNSTRGKERLGRISKQGDPYLRWLLVAGAMSVIRHGRKTGFANKPWLTDLMQRKPTKMAAVALANKTARTAWAVLVTGETYRRPAMAEA
ncbi:MAG: IS110 family transposase [Verrucomicrobia bacterium]|nr:IS110 family transposase [Verrucomicrobiota bacterium]